MLKAKVLNLRKSFKAAKCISSLKLAVSRIKILKNKREAVVKQLRRDIAHLIELGEEQTAQLQVEHVIREEKTMAAYEYIKIFCEFLAARMSMIESQKACPTDLKEAISSLIFASPRCTDIPELKDVRKHFEAKYGKEFITAAVEIHPDCGVYRTLVEKLSAVRPDDQTKQKILSLIAEEHKIKRDPNSYVMEDINSCEDLQVAHNGNHKDGVPTVVIPLKHEVEGHPTVINVLLDNVQSPSCQQDNVSARVGFSLPINPELTPSVIGIEAIEIKQMEKTASPLTGPNEYLEFLDATSAAWAAAEAAEHASMAARAAVELSRSGKLTKPYSRESDFAGGRAIRAHFGETDMQEAPEESEISSRNEVPVDEESDVDFVVFDDYDSDGKGVWYDVVEGATSDVDELGNSSMIARRDPTVEPPGVFRLVDSCAMSNADWDSREPNATAGTEDLTERVSLNLEKLPTSNNHGHSQFQPIKGIVSSSEKTAAQTPRDRGREAHRVDQPSPRKLIPFFDSDSGESSEDDTPTNRPVLTGKVRVDPTLSRRTRKQ